MGDRAKKLRQRRQERRQRAGQQNGSPTYRANHAAAQEGADRPTEQRAAYGYWVRVDGRFQDLAPDMVGSLLMSKQITPEQEQAARTWQSLRARYASEVGLKLPKSCLLDVVAGHDDGDGDPEVMRRYREVEAIVGRPGMREVLNVCQDGGKPRSLDLLRRALDGIKRA